MTAIVVANLALILAALAVGIVSARRHHAGGSDDHWPAFWFVVAVVALLLVVGRAVDAGELLADAGRRQARVAGWYRTRSVVQTALIASVLVGAVVIAAIGALRRPGRLAACAPTALLTGALVTYAAIRIVSLHDVDALANKVGPGGFTLGDDVEFLLLVATGATCVTHLVRITRRRPGDHELWPPPELRSR